MGFQDKEKIKDIYIYIVNIFQWLIWEGNLLTYNFMISELYKTQQD